MLFRSMGQTSSQAAAATASAPPSGCPMHNKAAQQQQQPAQCPVSHSPSSSSSQTLDSNSQRPAQCPIDHGDNANNTLNPLNQMPSLSQTPSSKQSTALPTERTSSSIPRSAPSDSQAESVWEYPSPQQFYNALVRKGWETPEEHVEMMVQIHNFLNERAWDEVMKWERRKDR